MAGSSTKRLPMLYQAPLLALTHPPTALTSPQHCLTDIPHQSASGAVAYAESPINRAARNAEITGVSILDVIGVGTISMG